MSEEIQEVVEEVDELLKKALEDANIYRNHDTVRPSAVRAFSRIEDARLLLDQIDDRNFNEGE